MKCLVGQLATEMKQQMESHTQVGGWVGR